MSFLSISDTAAHVRAFAHKAEVRGDERGRDGEQGRDERNTTRRMIDKIIKRVNYANLQRQLADANYFRARLRPLYLRLPFTDINLRSFRSRGVYRAGCSTTDMTSARNWDVTRRRAGRELGSINNNTTAQCNAAQRDMTRRDAPLRSAVTRMLRRKSRHVICRRSHANSAVAAYNANS